MASLGVLVTCSAAPVTCVAADSAPVAVWAASPATGSLLPLFLAGAFYLLMNTVVEVVFDRLNKRMDYYRG